MAQFAQGDARPSQSRKSLRPAAVNPYAPVMASKSQTVAPLVYVASPLGFTEAGRRFNAEHLLPALDDAGFAFFDPWSQGTDAADPMAIGKKNALGIEGCDALLCVLEGQELDGGTCAEVGYAG